MLYHRNFKLEPNFTFIQVHVPRTSGTSMRQLFSQLFGEDKCLMSYKGEMEVLTPQQLMQYRLMAGHFEYGLHQYLPNQSLYLTTIRHPVDRLVSTYAEFLTNEDSPFQMLAKRLDINAFVRHCLKSPNILLRGQFHNLQTRLISCADTFAQAKEYIDHKYFLASPFEEAAHMSEIVAELLGCKAPPYPRVHESKPKLPDYVERTQMSPSTLELLLESEREDFLLYNYVQQSYRDLCEREGWNLPALQSGPQVLDGQDLLQKAIQDMQSKPQGEFKMLILPDSQNPAQAGLAATRETGIWHRQSDAADQLPAYVCEEMQLLASLARANLEICAQKTVPVTANDGALLDCHLRLRPRPLPLHNKIVRYCNICGGEVFGPGPQMRMAANNHAPNCLHCGSLERHRIQYRILQNFPIGFWLCRSTCLIGSQYYPVPGNAPDLIPELNATSCINQISRAGKIYDFISLSHLLERLEDDQAGFQILLNALSTQGMLFITFAEAESRPHTVNLTPGSNWDMRRNYGRDLYTHLGCAQKGLSMLEVDEADPHTRVRQRMHLFFKDRQLANQAKMWIQSFSPSAIINDNLAA